jgi:GT2 family glycosyltransferase
MVKLSVIVLCYHGDRWIGPCMESLENQSLDRDQYEIILVDNGGSTPSINNYENRDNVKILHLTQNHGFTGGNNRALSHAGGEIVVLMNQDIEVHFNCLQELSDRFAKMPEAGVVSANMQMVRSGADFDLHAPVPATAGSFRLTGMGYALYELKIPQTEMMPVKFVSGNGLSFRRSVLPDIGNYLFDSSLGSYAEDLDFSIRMNKTPWKMFVNPRAVIFHYRDDSLSGSPVKVLKKFSHISSNRLVVYYNHLKPGRFMQKLPFLLAGVPFKVGRLDGEDGFNWSRFLAGLLATPFALAMFLKKVLNKNQRH